MKSLCQLTDRLHSFMTLHFCSLHTHADLAVFQKFILNFNISDCLQYMLQCSDMPQSSIKQFQINLLDKLHQLFFILKVDLSDRFYRLYRSCFSLLIFAGILTNLSHRFIEQCILILYSDQIACFVFVRIFHNVFIFLIKINFLDQLMILNSVD